MNNYESFEDLEIQFFDTDFQFSLSEELNSRYIKPPVCKRLSERLLKYEHAQKLAKDINFKSNERIFCLLSGNFIYGEFLEALFRNHNIYTEKLQITTLSMSYLNIINLKNLMTGNFVNEIDLIISDYFYSHERNGLIKDIYKQLDIDNRFQLSVAAIHTKIASFKTLAGKHIVISGSANLRSSNCIEQIIIEDSEKIFNFVTDYNNSIIEKYKTINKSLRGGILWQQIQEKEEKVEIKPAKELPMQ